MTMVYLSHPLTSGGRSVEDNRASAAAMANALQEILGTCALVYNPCALVVPGWTTRAYMIAYAQAFKSKTFAAVVFAPDWETSVGCRAEHFGADCLGIPRFYFDEDMLNEVTARNLRKACIA